MVKQQLLNHQEMVADSLPLSKGPCQTSSHHKQRRSMTGEREWNAVGNRWKVRESPIRSFPNVHGTQKKSWWLTTCNPYNLFFAKVFSRACCTEIGTYPLQYSRKSILKFSPHIPFIAGTLMPRSWMSPAGIAGLFIHAKVMLVLGNIAVLDTARWSMR